MRRPGRSGRPAPPACRSPRAAGARRPRCARLPPRRGRRARGRRARGARGGPACSRWSAARARAGPRRRRPRRTRSGPSWVPCSTTPTAKPARSSSSGAMTPACSAVSPPMSCAARLPAALVHARDDGGHPVGVDLSGRDVVEHEQRLRAHAHQVVDAHGDQVDADGVVAAAVAGHDHLGAHPVGRGHQHRPGVARRRRGGTGPPKPPMPATMDRSRSTAASPAAMSTPAPA